MVIGLVSLIIITVSAILQYISHRHNVVDTRFEREQKIMTQLGEEQVEVEGFSNDELDLSIRVLDVDVKENTSRIYHLKKILVPTSDIEGTTVVKIGVKPDHGIPPGMYAIEGWESDEGVLRGIFLNVPDSKDMMTVEINTVGVYEVPPKLSENLGMSRNLKLVDKTEDAEDFGKMAQEMSTPTTAPYSPNS